MSAEKSGVVSPFVKVFKYVLDELVAATPKHKKEIIYKKHLKAVNKRNNTKKRMIKTKGGAVREYAEKPFKQKDHLKIYILMELLNSEYVKYAEDCTLNEIGFILGFSRERVRQIEAQGLLKIRNPRILLALNEKHNLESVMEHKDLVLERKRRLRG